MSKSETVINWFMTVMNAIVDTTFFFVNPLLLKLFALSVLVINLTKTGKKWVKYLINIIYLAYVILRITEIKDFVITARWDEFMAIVPFLCMVLLPALARETEYGKYILNYNAMIVYYIVFNAIWLLITPTDGNIVIVLIYALVMFILGQTLQFYGEKRVK